MIGPKSSPLSDLNQAITYTNEAWETWTAAMLALIDELCARLSHQQRDEYMRRYAAGEYALDILCSLEDQGRPVNASGGPV